MQIVATVSTERVQRMLGRMPSRLEREIYTALRDIGEDHLAAMGQRMERGRIGPAIGGGLVRSSTGALRRSFVRETQRTGQLSGMSMKLFSAGNRYANVQEFGGTIRPVKGRYLAVPMPGIRRENGSVVGKYSGGPRSLMGQIGPDGQPLTFVKKHKDGRLFIVENTAKGLKYLWRLVESVTLRGGLGWFDTWRHGQRERSQRLAMAAKRAVEGA